MINQIKYEIVKRKKEDGEEYYVARYLFEDDWEYYCRNSDGTSSYAEIEFATVEEAKLRLLEEIKRIKNYHFEEVVEKGEL